MASSDFVRDTLTKWKLSNLIKIFEDQEINEESFLLLTERDIECLIPTIGPRIIFRNKHNLLVKKQQTPSNVENTKVAKSSSAVSGKNMPSTSRTTTLPGKRKSDLTDAHKQSKKQTHHATSGTIASLDSEKNTVKKVMESVRSKLDEMPSTKLTVFLRDKIKTLEKDRKQIVGVFGKTGSGKSSLINAILDETKLLPSGGQGACTTVMIQVEANMTDDQYIAEIEFITVEDWTNELWPIVDKEHDDEEDCINDNEKITALYGNDAYGKDVEELMDRKYFSKVPEFFVSHKKLISCNTAEELSEEITDFTRSDTECDPSIRKYWPLVKCLTIKVPNSKELLEHVVLVDLPGNGDCNKSRDEMWKSFVGNCSAVWIVSDISRATSEKEAWDILHNTISLLGPGGECRSIRFICTKTDDIGDVENADKHNWILTRNESTKKKVKETFNKQKELKKHFSCGEEFFQVFTVSSTEYRMGNILEQEETEIPKLKKFLRNLNDHSTRCSDYISGAYGILSLIQGAKSSDMTSSKEDVCKVLEQRLKEKLESIGQYMEKPYKDFDQCLLQGVQKSEESCEKLINEVLRGKKHGGFQVMKSICVHDGVYKPKGKNKKEINMNERLASRMRQCIDESFTFFFPNDKCGPIKAEIENFTLDTNSLFGENQSMSLHLTFLKTEEKELKAKLVFDLITKKKEIYFTLSNSIKDSMKVSYRRAAAYKGLESLKKMTEELHQHAKKEHIFEKAKDDMLDQLTKLKDHIVMQLMFKIQESLEISLKTPNSSLLPDVTEDYNKIKELMNMLDSQTNPTAFPTHSVQGPTY
ncbi:hypothetical protein UPYG_G00107580 [Umbra pygmaea]|uniref:Dynamin N-terminal domain-containing protein n=1 Tax=Umbra pygmaea TaxID=75934 RepID=A0ABD0X273_UMBPY